MNIQIIKTNWQAHQHALKNIRQVVFINEQGVPPEDEWDDMDDKALHYLLYINNEAISCARMLLSGEDGKIGRVAVLKTHRHKGMAYKLMSFIINDAKQQGLKQLKLDAQNYIIPFYEKLGFIVCSEEFIDAGILHKSMQLQIHTTTN